MNEFEKQVFNSLSEEEQEKIAGGETINPDDDLTKEQCDKLKDAATSTAPTHIKNFLKARPGIINSAMGYAAPGMWTSRWGPRWWNQIKPNKPSQPLNPNVPEETQQSATDPNTTDKL